MRNSGLLSKYWDVLLASTIASCALYLLMRHGGIGISPDSVEYITTAENIRRYGRMVDFTGEALVLFPAGYPVLLATVMLLTGMKVLVFAPLLNIVLFCGVLLLTGIIVKKHEKPSACYRLLVLLAVVASRCLLQTYSMLWSETLFVFLTLLFIVQLRRYQQTQGHRSLFVLSLIVAVALVTRYAGIVLLATGSLLILADAALQWKKKLLHLCLFYTTGLSLLVLNLVRNSLVSASLTGVRQEAERSLSDNLADIGGTVSNWLPFLNGNEKAGTVLFFILVTIAFIRLAYGFLQQQFFKSYETITAAFFLSYALFIIAMATVSRFEELNSRLLLPMYIPMLLTGTSWLIPVLKRTTRVKKSILLFILLILYAGFHWHQYRQNAAAWEGTRDAGIPGYTEDSWTKSETIAYIRKSKDLEAGTIFANANDAIYFLTGKKAFILPHKDIPSEITRFLAQPSFYVIMFTDGDNPDLVSIDTIKKHKKLLQQKQFTDGVIYYFGSF